MAKKKSSPVQSRKPKRCPIHKTKIKDGKCPVIACPKSPGYVQPLADALNSFEGTKKPLDMKTWVAA